MPLLVSLTSQTRHFILPLVGRKLDGKSEVNPFGGTNFQGTASVFVRVLLPSLGVPERDAVSIAARSIHDLSGWNGAVGVSPIATPTPVCGRDVGDLFAVAV